MLWQPPTFPHITVISEILIEWQTLRQTILLITPHSEELAFELTGLGFKVAKITLKTDERQILKSNVVVANPAFVCCDLLKNYAFTRILVDEAQAVTEVSLLSAIAKDCR